MLLNMAAGVGYGLGEAHIAPYRTRPNYEWVKETVFQTGLQEKRFNPNSST